MRKTLLALAVACAGIHGGPAAAQDQYWGEVRWFAFNFCPTGWTAAAGQAMNIPENGVLFSLLSTSFGGDGKSTFRLPDLLGRAQVSADSSVYYATRPGSSGGKESETLPSTALPLYVATGSSTQVAVVKAAAGADASTTVNVPAQTAATGSGATHENRQPYLTMTACVATTDGTYPPHP